MSASAWIYYEKPGRNDIPILIVYGPCYCSVCDQIRDRVTGSSLREGPEFCLRFEGTLPNSWEGMIAGKADSLPGRRGHLLTSLLIRKWSMGSRAELFHKVPSPEKTLLPIRLSLPTSTTSCKAVVQKHEILGSSCNQITKHAVAIRILLWAWFNY